MGYRDTFKPVIDLVLAVVGIAVLSPLLLLTALAVRAALGPPVLFRQLRAGRHGRCFYIYKFRTMTDAQDDGGSLLPAAARLTKTGGVIRSLSLDELPQLFNVVKGDMSLVGPRPLLAEYLPLYDPEQARRHEVRPGITGWAQVNGRNALTWEEKFRLDVWYVDNLSLPLDVRILLLTALKVLSRDGVDREKGVAMPRFTGTGKGDA